MSSSQVQMFNFNGMNSVRTINNGDYKPMFCLTDVCKTLDISNSALSNFDFKKDGVDTIEVIDSLGRKQVVNFISQSNLMRVIFKSRKEEAVAFQDWVFDVVIPTILNTGSYNHAEYLRLLDDNGRLRDELNEADDFSRAVCTDYEQLLKLVRPYKMPNWLRN